MKMLIWMCKKTRKDKVRNELNGKKVNVISIKEKFRESDSIVTSNQGMQMHLLGRVI